MAARFVNLASVEGQLERLRGLQHDHDGQLTSLEERSHQLDESERHLSEQHNHVQQQQTSLQQQQQKPLRGSCIPCCHPAHPKTNVI